MQTNSQILSSRNSLSIDLKLWNDLWLWCGFAIWNLTVTLTFVHALGIGIRLIYWSQCDFCAILNRFFYISIFIFQHFFADFEHMCGHIFFLNNRSLRTDMTLLCNFMNLWICGFFYLDHLLHRNDRWFKDT